MADTTDSAKNNRTKTLASLVAHDPALEVVGDPARVISGIAVDSREVGRGDLFVALRGGYFDGHSFIERAIERGAAALLVERCINPNFPQIVARSSRAALPGVAAAFFDQPSAELAVVGVTGTDGKTTTCYLIEDVLRADQRQIGMIGTVSVKIGGRIVVHDSRQTTPESVDIQRHLRAMVDADVDWAIVEATSHGLDLHRLDDVDFRIAAVTNITHEHLEYHRTIAAYRRAKGRLFERVAANGGVAVVNLDDPGGREMLDYSSGASTVTYAIRDRAADVRAEEIRSDASGSSFVIYLQQTTLRCRLPMVGRFNVENALCAAAVGLAAGVSPAVIRDALECASPVPGRMMTIEEGQPFSVIVDYAHTPESLSKVLSLLRTLCEGGRLIVVSGSAGERDVEKRSLQGAECHRLADLSIFTTEDPRFEDPDRIISDIADGAIDAGGMEGQSFLRITDRRQAVRHALQAASAGDVVLLAGKGHEQSIIWGLERRPWDEDRVARGLLNELGYGGDQ
ncbi:MAG: UDP-N-acetylmuramoyl-L-alanyl-D-glutamate--2,6-diaminopimelate ligase [Thermomicrobiales bacterium]